MGNCWGTKKKQTPTSIANLNSGPISHTTTSGTSTSTRGSQYSASSGYGSSNSGQIQPTTNNLREFTFQELKVATRNFKADTLLGEGGFGKVYKGWIIIDDKLQQQQQHSYSNKINSSNNSHSGLTVAIKKLDSESLQGLEEWQSEVNFLGSLSHTNLVKLLGYCYDDNQLLLVYEFMQRGSLENHLFGRGSLVQPLPWDLRLSIAIGAARGLSFLHTSGDRIIYRDIKASNILLDGAYTPKISDFGLAKLGPSGSRSHVTTRVMGTHGYAAPEYVATGHLYVKSDVYGFGVVLIELLTGIRAIDPTRPTGKQTLVEWIKPYLSDKRKLKTVMDTGLQGKYPSNAAAAAAELALKCIQQEPKARPGMNQVLQTLESIQSMDVKPKAQRRSSGPNGSTIRPVSHGPRAQHSSARARR